jgi:hypothetical protein
MAMVTLQTAAEMEAAQKTATSGQAKNPLAGMNVLTAQGQEPSQKGIQITEKARRSYQWGRDQDLCRSEEFYLSAWHGARF